MHAGWSMWLGARRSCTHPDATGRPFRDCAIRPQAARFALGSGTWGDIAAQCEQNTPRLLGTPTTRKGTHRSLAGDARSVMAKNKGAHKKRKCASFTPQCPLRGYRCSPRCRSLAQGRLHGNYAPGKPVLRGGVLLKFHICRGLLSEAITRCVHGPHRSTGG